jgi:hypothetical protein
MTINYKKRNSTSSETKNAGRVKTDSQPPPRVNIVFFVLFISTKEVKMSQNRIDWTMKTTTIYCHRSAARAVINGKKTLEKREEYNQNERGRNSA